VHDVDAEAGKAIDGERCVEEQQGVLDCPITDEVEYPRGRCQLQMSVTVCEYHIDECSTFNKILMFEFETSTLGTPRPNRVDTICRMENMLAEMAARVMRAVSC
jgi:hypothetical protein